MLRLLYQIYSQLSVWSCVNSYLILLSNFHLSRYGNSGFDTKKVI